MDMDVLDRGRGVTDLRSLRKKNLAYVLIWVVYYAWVIAFTTWWTARPDDYSSAFPLAFRNLAHILNLLSSAACVCIFRKNWFAVTARVGAVAVIVSLALYFAAPSEQLKTLFTVLLGVSLGCVNISILIPFTFILNNTEKLLCVVASHALSNVITLLVGRQAMGPVGEGALAVGILFVSLSTVLFFRQRDIVDNDEDELITNKGARLAAVVTLLASTVGAVLFLGAGKAAFNTYIFLTGQNTTAWYYIGGIAGCLTYSMIFIFMKKNYHLTLTVPFAGLAFAFLCHSFSDSSQNMGVLFGIMLGVGTATGMSTVYYVLGVVGKKYNSMLYLRLSIGIIGICGGISGVLLGNVITNTQQTIIAVSVTSMVSILMILMFSPTISRICFDESWAGEFTLDDITALKQAVRASEEFDKAEAPKPPETAGQILTPDEQKVALLLIEGETPRDISRILSLDASEVNFTISSIRDKMKKGEYDTGLSAIVKKYNLTRRETDMLRCLRLNMTNPGIAAQLYLSEETVKIHVRNLIKKLPVENRREVAAWVEAFGKEDELNGVGS